MWSFRFALLYAVRFAVDSARTGNHQPMKRWTVSSSDKARRAGPLPLGETSNASRMPSMTSISVVIPAYDDAEMLSVCLQLLRSQTRPADEVIVVDNGSTDDTAMVAVDGGARLVSEPLRGILPATAAGFDAANGQILARLDADSRPAHDWLERIARTLTEQPGLTAVTGTGEFYGSSELVHTLGEIVYLGGYFWSMGLLLGHPPLFGSNFALRRSAWLRVRGKVHRQLREVHDDLDLSFNLEPDMTVLFDPELRVGVSARPFSSARGLGRRLGWAYTTIALNWRELPPGRRRALRRERALDEGGTIGEGDRLSA